MNRSVIEARWCGDSMPGYTIEDPFKMNLDLYFRRMRYHLIANITDTFAHTGVFSDPFRDLFLYLGELIQDDMK